MREILGVTDDGPAKRRWFHDEYFDLFVWETGEEVTLFQLAYGGDSTEPTRSAMSAVLGSCGA